MRIAFVGADAALLDKLASAFEAAGHEVLTALDRDRGFRLGRRADIDAVVIDVDTIGSGGFTLCYRLRAEGRRVPIVALTPGDAAVGEARGREAGVDDHLAKPVSPRILVARVVALLGRERLDPGERPQDVVRAGALELHRGRLEARYRGARVPVTMSEHRLLDALASQPGQVLSRAELLERMREGGGEVNPRIIDTYVQRLRRKLKKAGGPADLIQTVVGEGYRLAP